MFSIPPTITPQIWVERGSLEYALFINRLLESTLLDKSKQPQICLLCWAFITDKHTEHRDYVHPLPQNEHSFIQLAQDQKKLDGYRVAIFNLKPNPNLAAENPRVLQIRDGQPGLLNGHPIYQSCTQDAMEFKEFEKPETRYLPEDLNKQYEKCLQAARSYDVFPEMANPFDNQGAYAILNKESNLGERLGDATADDVLYLARRVKKMRQKIVELRDVIDVIYDVKYCGRGIEEVARRYIEGQREKERKVRERVNMLKKRGRAAAQPQKNDADQLGDLSFK